MSVLKHFATVVSGKWILAGEHAVLRGSPALVFPVYNNTLGLKFEDRGHLLQAKFLGKHGAELESLFWGLLKRALHACNKSEEKVTGHFELQNNIPLGAGMGASAALSVAMSKWCLAQGWIQESEVFEFARQLENLFHGESSGVDIAVVMAGHGLKFTRDGLREPVHPRWQPQWYLSYSGKRGMTSECVSHVMQMAQNEPEKAARLDAMMKRSVALAEEALLSENAESGLRMLKDSIDLAHSAFEGWSLTQGILTEHMKQLRRLGAIAVKPTGSGDGGFVLSLWQSPPPQDSGVELISLCSEG